MVNYRRVKIKGGHYFFTVALRNRHLDLLTKHIEILRYAMKDDWGSVGIDTGMITVGE